MATKQTIQIEITTNNYQKLSLRSLIAWIASGEKLDITRLEVKEVNKRR